MKVKIWREQKFGKQHGRKKSWEEDWYEISKLITDKSGETKYVLLIRNMVDDSFIQHNSEVYKNFIEENGERKDERYKTNS